MWKQWTQMSRSFIFDKMPYCTAKLHPLIHPRSFVLRTDYTFLLFWEQGIQCGVNVNEKDTEGPFLHPLALAPSLSFSSSLNVCHLPLHWSITAAKEAFKDPSLWPVCINCIANYQGANKKSIFFWTNATFPQKWLFKTFTMQITERRSYQQRGFIFEKNTLFPHHPRPLLPLTGYWLTVTRFEISAKDTCWFS